MHQLTGVMPDRTRKVLVTSKDICLNLTAVMESTRAQHKSLVYSIAMACSSHCRHSRGRHTLISPSPTVCHLPLSRIS